MICECLADQQLEGVRLGTYEWEPVDYGAPYGTVDWEKYPLDFEQSVHLYQDCFRISPAWPEARDTLLNLSLVSRGVSVMAQQALFRCFVPPDGLPGWSDHRRAERTTVTHFLRSILTHPRLASYVKEMFLFDYATPLIDDTKACVRHLLEKPASQLGHTEIVEACERGTAGGLLACLLPLIPKLNRLAVHVRHCDPSAVFSFLSEIQQQGVIEPLTSLSSLSLLASHSDTQFSLANFDDLLSLAPNLARLQTRECPGVIGPFSGSSMPPIENWLPKKIKVLHLDTRFSVIQPYLTTIFDNCPSLEVFHCRYDEKGMLIQDHGDLGGPPWACTQDLLDCIRPFKRTLKEFVLGYQDPTPFVYRDLDSNDRTAMVECRISDQRFVDFFNEGGFTTLKIAIHDGRELICRRPEKA